MNNNKRNRHRQFWQPLTKGEGAYLAIHAPMSDTVPPAPRPHTTDLDEFWTSVDFNVQAAEADAANTFYGQDAIQNTSAYLGPGVHAALLGSPYDFTWDSVWFGGKPIITDMEKPFHIETDKNHPLYKAIDAQTRALCEASKGRYSVAYTDIGGQYDVLYSMRGEEILADMIEFPDHVLALQDKIDDEFIKYFNYLTDIIAPYDLGFAGWIPIASDRPWYPLQCDMSVMISPKMFEKFVLPSLEKVANAIGPCIFHLDGPEQLQHLDMLLAMKNIHAIQWVPLNKNLGVAGRIQDFTDELSIEIYRRTLAAGRKVVLTGVVVTQIPKIFDAIGTDGVFIQTYLGSRKEADELINHAQKSWLRV